MNLPASPLALCGVCLIAVLTCNAQNASAQSAPATAHPQEANSLPPAKAASKADAAKETPPAQTKPEHPLSLNDRAWEILHGGLTFDGTEKRVKAVTALAVLKGNTEAEKLAIAALKDPKADVRVAAANALGAMHAVRARDRLEVALDDNEPAVVLAAANSLMLLKEANFAYDVYYNVLTGTMRTNNGALREQIKEQLKVLHNKKKIAEMGLEQGVGFIPYGGLGYGMVKTFVKSDNSPVRAAAAKKLAHDPDPATAKALVAATQDKNSVVRAAALEAIAERGDRSLISKIAPSLDDDKDEVRFAGAACVARLSAGPVKRRAPATSVASAAVPN
ncbi:MAG TPA: HEAT repeat domain-containing protein [Candidatus Acidoferrum sp.]